MDKLTQVKQEITDLFGFNDDLAAANQAVIEFDAKQLIAYRLTVDEKATPKEWVEAMVDINKYKRYLELTSILGITNG
jgi:hypothetical protein